MDLLWLGVALAGCTIVWDGITSWTLYASKPSYYGKKQTFKTDHWVRLIRILVGLYLIVAAVIYFSKIV